MVCMGNICRSPLAEGILKDKAKKAGLNWTIESAGTLGYNPGCPPHPLAQQIANEYGIDICNHKCRRFTKDNMDSYDRIYVMDDVNYDDVKRIARDKWNKHKVDYLLNAVFPGENRSVPDPFHGTEDEFRYAYQLIDEACERIVEKEVLSTKY